MEGKNEGLCPCPIVIFWERVCSRSYEQNQMDGYHLKINLRIILKFLDKGRRLCYTYTAKLCAGKEA